MAKIPSERKSRRKWLLTPLVVGGLVLALASPAFAVGGKLPITPGATVPVAVARTLANLRHDEVTCQRTTLATVRSAVVLDYRSITLSLVPLLASAGNTSVVPNIGFYCPQSGVKSNITAGMLWTPVEFANSLTNLRHDAIQCVQTTIPAERQAVTLDYNIIAFAPGNLQDKLIAEGDPLTVPPITTFCPQAA